MRVVAACLAALVVGTGAAQPPETGVPPYRVECTSAEPVVCRADLATYVGWRVFNAECATCHAADARGTSFAPNLTERLRGMTMREFFAALDHGYLGPDSTMPPRGRDPAVSPYYEELWAYLAARRSGDLPAGPVEVLVD